ncbi:MAG: glycosyltransferase family 2 protein [Thermodesulforhabdaceae bacterium]
MTASEIITTINPPSEKNTAAVIVTFYPPADMRYTLNVLTKQVDRIIIIDNTPALDRAQSDLKFNNALFIPVGRNLGVARAQNLGISLAISMGYEWILLLDQDSKPASDFMKVMHRYFSSLTKQEKEQILMLAPNLCDESGGFFYTRVAGSKWMFRRVDCKGKQSVTDVLIAISSGSLIPVTSFQRIGFMDDNLFIDHVDNDFCLRGICKRLKIHVVCDAVVFHRLGNLRRVYSIGRLSIKSSFYTPFRRYFIYRNRMIIWKRYFRKVPAFVFHDIFSMLYDLLKIILVEDLKRCKLQAAFEGLLSGLKMHV